MMKITYYAKEIINCEYPLESNDHIAKHYAGQVECPNWGNDHAVVVNDGDNRVTKDWSIECGDCDFQVYGVEVIDCSNDSNEDYYALFPDECPCSICSNEEPDNEWCWKQAAYVTDVEETHRITLHISATSTQEASCDVPLYIIKQGGEAVFQYIIGNTYAEYTDWDYDCLENEGLSWTEYNADVASSLDDSKAESYMWNDPLTPVQDLMNKLMNGIVLTTEELQILQTSSDTLGGDEE